MPLWKIYHPEGVFTEEDKASIAKGITAIYPLPKFYVGVLFQELAKQSFYIGGEASDDFVRIWVDHIARTMDSDKVKDQFFTAVNKLLSPYMRARGLRWELHIDETPFSLWRVQGMVPPRPNTPAEQKWREENHPSEY